MNPSTPLTILTMNPESESLGRLPGASFLSGLLVGLISLFLVGTISNAADAPPGRLTFQSYLTDEGGSPIGAGASGENRKIRFYIYTEASVGVVKWAEEQVVNIRDGHFSVILGTGSPVSTFNHDLSKAFSDTTLNANTGGSHLEIRVSPNATDVPTESDAITPRLQLLTSPYAFFANRALRADKLVDANGDSVISIGTDSASIDGNITQAVGSTASLQATTVNGVLTAAGNIAQTGGTFASLKMTTINGVLTAAGDINQTAGAAANLKATTINGELTAKGNIDQTEGTSANLKATTVNGVLTAAGNITQTEGTSASLKATTINGTADITGDATLGDGTSTVTLNSTLNQTGYEGNTANSLKETTINGGATISGEVAINNGGISLNSSPVNGKYRRHITMEISDSSNSWRVMTGDDEGTSAIDNNLSFFYGTIPRFILEVDGDLEIKGSLTQSSDRRLKKNVVSVGNGMLDKMSRLSAVRYHLNTDAEQDPKRVGFIAQEVQAVFPELVRQSGEFMSLSYADFGVLSVAAIKELRAETGTKVSELSEQNERLQHENAALKKQFGDLLSRLQALEAKSK